MSALTLTLQQQPANSVDMSGITPDKLATLSNAEIAALPLQLGKQPLRLDDLFNISGTANAANQALYIEGACDKLHYLGAGMTSGTFYVTGDTGAYLGQAMRGGEIIVDGNAGDLVGAAAAGERLGMRGGLILIKGNAGDRLGERQRRGTILVEGDVGHHCAAQMIAGTIAVLGHTPPSQTLASGMKRGSVLLAQYSDLTLPSSFNYNGQRDLNFLTLLFSSLTTLNSTFSQLSNLSKNKRVQRWLGDQANQGLGEILFFTS